MHFFQHSNGNSEFQDIEPWLAREITTVVQAHDPGKATIAAHLLAAPNHDDEQLCADWEEHVHPDLMILWSGCYRTVMSDLESMAQNLNEKKNTYNLMIPSAHREAWLRMLNIVRLSLAAEHQFSEQEMSENQESNLSTPRGEALITMGIFASMLQALVVGE